MTSLPVILPFLAWRDARHTKDEAERPHISIMLRLTSDTYRVLIIANSGRSIALNCRLRLRGGEHGLTVETPEFDDDGTLRIIDNPPFDSNAELPAGWMYEFLLQDGEAYAEDLMRKFILVRSLSMSVSNRLVVRGTNIPHEST